MHGIFIKRRYHALKLSEAFELYKQDKKIEGYSPHTLKAYNIQKNVLIRYTGDIHIEDMNQIILKQYIANDIERLKASSIGHRVRFLKSLFTWLHNEGILDQNIARKLKEPKQGARIPKFIKEEDLELLRDSCANVKERALLEVLYSTGCRIGEIYSLNIRDVNFTNNSIRVIGKGDKEREVYFNVKCRIQLERYIKSRLDEDDSLFATERKPYRRTSIAQLRNIIKRISKRSGVEVNVFPHRLRHSYCQHLLDKGAPIETISDLVGHSRVSTTKIYAHLSGERRREMYNRYF